MQNSICSDDQCLRIPRLRSPCCPPSEGLQLTLGLVMEVMGGASVASQPSLFAITEPLWLHHSHRVASIPTTAGSELGSDFTTFRLFTTMFHCLSPECVCPAIGWPSQWVSFWCPYLPCILYLLPEKLTQMWSFVLKPWEEVALPLASSWGFLDWRWTYAVTFLSLELKAQILCVHVFMHVVLFDNMPQVVERLGFCSVSWVRMFWVTVPLLF